MKTIPMEGDIKLAPISKAGPCAWSSPAQQSLRLSIEETGGPEVQEHVSVEESGRYEISNTPVIDDLRGNFCDIHQSKVPRKLKTDEPQYPVPAKMTDDVEPQTFLNPSPEPEAGSSKTLSHEEEAKLGTVEDVPTGETPIIPAEIVNDQLTGIADPCEMQSLHVPSGDLKERKKKRKRRRKSVEKTVEQFLYESSLELRRKLKRVLQLSPKMFSGLKAFGTSNLFEVVRGGFRSRFPSSALGGAVVERGAILILLLLMIFHSTCGLKTCKYIFNSPTPIDYPVTLLNLKDLLQPTCNLKEIARCPGQTKCKNNISLCLWNNCSIIFYFFEENTGTYSLEYGIKTDNQKTISLGNKDCKEYSTPTVRTSRRDPQQMTTKTNPTKHPGDETSTVPPGVIAGGMIAVLIVLAAVGGIFWWCHRRQGLADKAKGSMEKNLWNEESLLEQPVSGLTSLSAPTTTSLLNSATSSKDSVI